MNEDGGSDNYLTTSELSRILGLIIYLNKNFNPGDHSPEVDMPLCPDGFAMYDSNGESVGKISYQDLGWVFVPAVHSDE
jgi:hypothetical protein